ncbi:MAG TPA: hypothetical protein VMU06_13010 [Stellaceae bacterium]|nr:hypothetical protein [Stellaceae bacterium]
MPKLRALPFAQFGVGRHHYQADAQGYIEAHPDDVGALLNVGCLAVEPWQAPAAPGEPPPPLKPEPPKVKVRAHPFATFGMPTGEKYVADKDGFIVARKDHGPILLRAGCAPV